LGVRDREMRKISILMATVGVAFSARGATEEGILEAAEEDRRKLIQAHTNSLGPEAAIVAPVT
jgi:hypothetical protein